MEPFSQYECQCPVKWNTLLPLQSIESRFQFSNLIYPLPVYTRLNCVAIQRLLPLLIWPLNCLFSFSRAFVVLSQHISSARITIICLSLPALSSSPALRRYPYSWHLTASNTFEIHTHICLFLHLTLMSSLSFPYLEWFPNHSTLVHTGCKNFVCIGQVEALTIVTFSSHYLPRVATPCYPSWLTSSMVFNRKVVTASWNEATR